MRVEGQWAEEESGVQVNSDNCPWSRPGTGQYLQTRKSNSLRRFLKRSWDLFSGSYRGIGVKTGPGTGRNRLIKQSLLTLTSNKRRRGFIPYQDDGLTKPN